MITPIAYLFVLAAAPVAATAAQPAGIEPAKSLPVCQAWGPKPPACAEPPLQERVTIYNSWREPQGDHPATATMIRRPSLIDRGGPPLVNVPFPQWLRAGSETRQAEVTVDLVIAPDGAIVSCRGARVDAFEYAQGKRAELPADQNLGEAACALVKANRKFRPAIDAEGRRIEAPVAVAVYYMRQRYDMLAPPAPPPPSRFLGPAPYSRRDAWPPAYSLDAPISLTPPKFKNFLADRKGLPKKAVTGAVIDIANTGQAVRCDLRVSSGDKRLDDATCAGLLSVQTAPRRWPLRGLPVEVNWQGEKARVQLASPETLPSLVSPIIVPPEQRPASPSKWPVRVRVLLDPQGKPVSCMILGVGEDDALDAAACKLARQAAFTAGKDGFGRPVASGMDLRVDWSKGTLTLPGY
ncbi:energy transducer TonB [Novosphingobium sp. TH158]|uniref:energy transducer TonB n=1 Tax=Novosphingobium sp. TH158 TaxID=2067455 RepID=UPI001181C361|nr:energy transducer TonB [Novosphingobium sp. TH158]